MWRPILQIVLAAALGSLAATILFGLFVGGTGGLDPISLVFWFATGTMFLTLPGATMLYGLRASFLERGLPQIVIGILLTLIGTSVGGAALLFISAWDPLQTMAVGGLYGGLTAVALLLMQTLPGLSPSAAR